MYSLLSPPPLPHHPHHPATPSDRPSLPPPSFLLPPSLPSLAHSLALSRSLPLARAPIGLTDFLFSNAQTLEKEHPEYTKKAEQSKTVFSVGFEGDFGYFFFLFFLCIFSVLSVCAMRDGV